MVYSSEATSQRGQMLDGFSALSQGFNMAQSEAAQKLILAKMIEVQLQLAAQDSKQNVASNPESTIAFTDLNRPQQEAASAAIAWRMASEIFAAQDNAESSANEEASQK